MHHGPLFPEHICGPADSPWWAKNQDDDCVMIANAAFCGDDAKCLAAAELFGGDTGYYNDVDPDSGYAYYDEDNEGDRSYIGGGSDSLNHQTTTSSANYMPYIIVGGVLTTFLMALVWRKRGTIENDELKKEFAGSDLNGAVKSRMERVQAGDDVPPVTISFEPSFVPSQSDDYIMA